MVRRLTLDQVSEVRILDPQPIPPKAQSEEVAVIVEASHQFISRRELRGATGWLGESPRMTDTLGMTTGMGLW